MQVIHPHCLGFTLTLSPTQAILCTRSLHPRTVACTAQKTSQVADVSTAVRALRAPPREPFLLTSTPTLCKLLPCYYPNTSKLSVTALWEEDSWKKLFSHHDKSTSIRTKWEALVWLTLTSEKISFFYLPPFHYLRYLPMCRQIPSARIPKTLWKPQPQRKRMRRENKGR